MPGTDMYTGSSLYTEHNRCKMQTAHMAEKNQKPSATPDSAEWRKAMTSRHELGKGAKQAGEKSTSSEKQFSFSSTKGGKYRGFQKLHLVTSSVSQLGFFPNGAILSPAAQGAGFIHAQLKTTTWYQVTT